MNSRSAEFLEQLTRQQLVVAVRTASPEEAYQAAEACITGGIRLIEITFSVPDADEVITRLTAREGVRVGAGTVLTRSEARRALRAGAGYIVSPNLDEALVKFIKKEGAVSIPGACTPSEIYRAYRAGADVIKLFPFAEIGGLNFLKAIRGPFPFIKYMLCGGGPPATTSERILKPGLPEFSWAPRFSPKNSSRPATGKRSPVSLLPSSKKPPAFSRGSSSGSFVHPHSCIMERFHIPGREINREVQTCFVRK